jgi:TnpA family transposase
MKKHEILSPYSRAALFGPPTDLAAIVRHYTLSPDDFTLIRQRRRHANRLGFAIHLAYLKFPSRFRGSEEKPASDVGAFLTRQLGVESYAYSEYAQRDETRREHIGKYSRICGFIPSPAVIIGPLRRSRRPKLLARFEAM